MENGYNLLSSIQAGHIQCRSSEVLKDYRILKEALNMLCLIRAQTCKQTGSFVCLGDLTHPPKHANQTPRPSKPIVGMKLAIRNCSLVFSVELP